jgi:hypothetical protein
LDRLNCTLEPKIRLTLLPRTFTLEPLWNIVAHPTAMKVYPEAMETHPGVMEAHPGAMEAHFLVMEAHSGAMEANHGTTDAHMNPWKPTMES